MNLSLPRYACVPPRINSDRGRTEYSLVNLIPGEMGFTAYPMGKGSGSVTTFSMADGFFAIDAQTEIVQAGETVEVQLLSETLNPADLVVIGSHCAGLDLLLGILHEDGFSTKSLFVGSMGGLAAVKRGECDVAGLHLFDPRTAEYNRPFLTDDLELAAGYRRQQCLVFRKDDARFLGAETPEQLLKSALREKDCTMVNRNAGSGTRVLLDELLAGARPPGYALQPKSHNAVSAAIAQGRADWGVAIRTVAESYGLACLPMKAEHYDFAIPKNRLNRPAVQAFLKLFQDPGVRGQLQNAGFEFG